MSSAFGLAPLALGLALGATAGFALRHARAASSADTVSPTSAASAPAIIHHQSYLINNPRLDADSADAALAAYLALPPLPDRAPPAEVSARSARLRALLTLLPDSHLEKLLAGLAPRVGGAEAQLRRIAFTAWTERDSPAAARWALALTPGEAINAAARDRYLHQAVRAWGEADFDAAYAWVGALSDAPLASGLAGALLAQLMSVDPLRAHELARARGAEFFKGQRLTFLQVWAEKDPAAALQTWGADFERGDFDQWAVIQTLRGWMARDTRGALEWIVTRPAGEDSERQSLLSSLTYHMGNDPKIARAAAEFIAARPDLPGQRGLLRELTQTWVRTDARATLAWLDTLPDVERRNELIDASLFLVKSDDFLAFARRLPEGPAREKRIANYVAIFAESSPEKALAWIEASDAPELTAGLPRVQGALIANIARTDPSAALARWQALPEADRLDAAGPIARAWTENDPAAAAAWMLPLLRKPGLAEAQTRDLSDGYFTAISQLARTDPEAVLRLAETATGDAQGNAYFALANDNSMGSRHDGETSVSHSRRADLLASIPDAKTRETPLDVLLGNWLQRDYDAARAWIESHDAVSPESAARLLERHDPATLRTAY